MPTNEPNNLDDEEPRDDLIEKPEVPEGIQDLEDFLESITFFDRRVTSDLQELAHEFTKSGQLAEAEACCRKALWATSQFKDSEYVKCSALTGLARTLEAQSRFAEAEAFFREAYELADSYPMIQSTCWGIARQLELLFESQGNLVEKEIWKQRADGLLEGQMGEILRLSKKK